MAIESGKARVLGSNLDGKSKEELLLFISQLIDGLQAICAKLDADATVTDTNYAAVLATYITD